MKFSLGLVAALAAAPAIARTALGDYAYNKWHETELERWLSDHNIPHPSPADRADLIDTVNKNWEQNVAEPYSKWDAKQLQSYLGTQGQKVKKGTEQNTEALLAQVKSVWHETSNQASDAYSSVSEWFFDSWTDSQLKSFLDYHHIPNPSPRTRDSLLSTVRSNYASAAQKIGETAAYPGDWLYQSWGDSDLKAWLDARGLPAPQPSTRDKLVASVRRNARIASNQASKAAASASASAKAAQNSITNAMFDSWTESQFKEWADKNGIPVPQGSNLQELRAFARKKQSSLFASGTSAYGAATTSAGNYFAEVTNEVYQQGKYWYDWALNQAGVAGEEAKSSFSSLSVVAASSASSLSVAAASSASSLSVVASSSALSLSKAAASASSSASKAAVKSGADASKAARSAMSSVSAQASSSASSLSASASSSAKLQSLKARAEASTARAKASASSLKNEL